MKSFNINGKILKIHKVTKIEDLPNFNNYYLAIYDDSNFQIYQAIEKEKVLKFKYLGCYYENHLKIFDFTIFDLYSFSILQSSITILNRYYNNKKSLGIII